MKTNKLLFLALILLFFQACNPTTVELFSPDGTSTSEIVLNNGIPFFSVDFNNEQLIQNARLDIVTESNQLLENLQIAKVEKSTFDETWETVNGKNKTVRNHYNQYLIHFKNEKGGIIQMKTRIYNKGFAYRFIFPEEKSVVENTSVSLSGDFTFWSYNGENHNVGPIKLSEYKNDIVRNPVVFYTANKNYFAIHEAAIFEHAPFELFNSGNNTLCLHQECISESNNLKTSWRAFIFGEKPGDLLESNLLVNLNEPCKIEDTSWIKPGKAMWDWRVWGYKAADGFEYGLNTVSHKRFIDFATENNIQYLLIDADWYGPEFSKDSDPTKARKGVNIEECMAYAKEKGIGVILYLNDVGAKKFGLERVLKQFAEWGAVGVKYGFMRGTPKEKVLHTRQIVELCAKYKLIVNFHDGPIAPSGDRRTWPNLITKEFCHSQADAKRSYFPETIVTTTFVNMITGPLDMCNGWFALNSAFGNGRPKVFQEIPGTVAAEVAKLIAVYGGCYVLPDAPEEYLKKDDLFDCIRQMPAEFDSFKVLDGEIGKFISVARQAGDKWFIGSLTNRESRELSINLDFLEEGQQYIATYYEDAPDTHFENNKEAYQVQKDIPVKKGDIIKTKLAPGGGHSIMILKK